ncbi:MAG: OmpA family protein, partial [bacterium]|nr:OmpA family protein [bacterium]
AVSSWFGKTDTPLPSTGGEQPNPPAAVQAPPEPGAPAPVTPSLADIDVMTPAQLKAIEAELSAERSAQIREDEARRKAAVPKSPQTLQNNIFAGLYEAIGGSGMEDLKTAWNEAALARSNPEPVPVTPVEVAELAPIAGTELRTASAPAQALPAPEAPQLTTPAANNPTSESFNAAESQRKRGLTENVIAQKWQEIEAARTDLQARTDAYVEGTRALGYSDITQGAAWPTYEQWWKEYEERVDAFTAKVGAYRSGDRDVMQQVDAAARTPAGGTSEGITRTIDAIRRNSNDIWNQTPSFWEDPVSATFGGATRFAEQTVADSLEASRNLIEHTGQLGETLGFSNPERAIGRIFDPVGATDQLAKDAAIVGGTTVAPWAAGRVAGFFERSAWSALPRSVTSDVRFVMEDSAGFPSTVTRSATEAAVEPAASGALPAVSSDAAAIARTEAAANEIRALSGGRTGAPASGGNNPYAAFDAAVADARAAVAPKMPTAANIEPAGTPSAPGPYAAFDNAVADARAGAGQPNAALPASGESAAAQPAVAPDSIYATLQSAPGEAGASMVITDLKPLSRGGQGEIFTANVTEAGVADAAPHSVVVKRFDANTSANEIGGTLTTYNKLVDQGFGSFVPNEYSVDTARKIAVMTNLNSNDVVALSANNLSNELLSPRSLTSVPTNLTEVARNMTETAVALGQRGIEVNYDAYLLAIDPAASRAAGFSITDLSSVADRGAFQGYFRGSVDYNVREVQAALDQFGTSWSANKTVSDAFRSEAGAAVQDAYAGATANQTFFDRALVGFGLKEPAVPPAALGDFTAGTQTAFDSGASNLTMKDWAGGTGVTAGVLCLGFCPSSEPLPQEAVPAEIVPLSKEDIALLFPQENKVQQPSAPSEVSMPVNIVIEEARAQAMPSPPLPASSPVSTETQTPAERPVISPTPPAAVPTVLTAPPASTEADLVLSQARAEDAAAKVLAEMEIQGKKNEEALAAWDEAQRQRTKEMQDTIARLEKERVDMNLPSPVIVPQDTPQNISPGAQGVGPLSSDDIARGLLPNPASEGSRRKDLEINFESGSAKLLKDGREQVAALAQVMSRDEFRNSTFNIVGHTDTVGTAEANLVLSRQRAQAIVDILNRDYGIPLGQMKATGVGQWVLKVPILGNVPANRRVEIVVTPRK